MWKPRGSGVDRWLLRLIVRRVVNGGINGSLLSRGLFIKGRSHGYGAYKLGSIDVYFFIVLLKNGLLGFLSYATRGDRHLYIFGSREMISVGFTDWIVVGIFDHSDEGIVRGLSFTWRDYPVYEGLVGFRNSGLWAFIYYPSSRFSIVGEQVKWSTFRDAFE